MVFFYFLFHHEHNFSSNMLKRIQLVLQIVQLGFSWKLELASTTQYTPPPGTLRARVTVEDWLVMLAFIRLRIRTRPGYFFFRERNTIESLTQEIKHPILVRLFPYSKLLWGVSDWADLPGDRQFGNYCTHLQSTRLSWPGDREGGNYLRTFGVRR